MPTEKSLKLLAPDKNHKDVIKPMEYLKNEIAGYKEEKNQIIKRLFSHLLDKARKW